MEKLRATFEREINAAMQEMLVESKKTPVNPLTIITEQDWDAALAPLITLISDAVNQPGMFSENCANVMQNVVFEISKRLENRLK
jgi:hypothetical protein